MTQDGKPIRYIDLFGGIGGFRLGITQATQGNWECVWYNDFNKYSTQIYNKNFKEKYEPKDIRKIQEKTIPQHDLICAGFPCQSFSMAGKRKGFEDTRGTLFFEICRIARFHKPKYLFLENVKGLLSSNKRETFKKILESLWELGYDVEWQVLNSKNHGVPQNRERVFIIGHLGGFRGRQIFPLREGNEMGYKEQKHIEMIQNSGKEIARIYNPDGLSPTLKGKTGGWQEPKIIDDLYKKVREDRITNHCPALRHNCGELKVLDSLRPTLKGKTGGWQEPKIRVDNLHHHRIDGYGNGIYYNETPVLDSGCGRDIAISNAVDCDEYLRSGKRPRDKNGKPKLLPIGNRRIRKLTPIECERLQGFPDNWTHGVSNTQRYKMLGNAVTVNVIFDITKKWYNHAQ